MGGQRIGYIRISSFDQNPGRQLDQIQTDRVFTLTLIAQPVGTTPLSSPCLGCSAAYRGTITAGCGSGVLGCARMR